MLNDTKERNDNNVITVVIVEVGGLKVNKV
jgi:hypothetical protein